jgi:small subunit ribosomal protein S21
MWPPGLFLFIEKEVSKVVQVILQEGESFDSLLKRFRKKMMRANVLSTVKKKRYFISESERRRRAQLKARRRARRRQYLAERRYGRA